MLLVVLLLLQFLSVLVRGDLPKLEIVSSVYVDLLPSSCVSQGFQYYDVYLNTCGSCSSANGYVADTSTVSYLGDPLGCKCGPGYVKIDADCSATTTGACVGFTCSKCAWASGNSSYEDSSACAHCGSGSASVTSGTCNCGSGRQVDTNRGVIECVSCSDNSKRIDSNLVIAGKQYYASSYKCQKCPDPHMTFNADLTCTCSSDYQLVGVASIGAQSCVLKDTASTYISQESSAITIMYNTTSVGTLQSLTLQHYFVKSASRCNAYGGSSFQQDCSALANLCVLQLYDDSTVPCSVFSGIIKNRGTGNINALTGTGYGMPWLSYTQGADAVCKDKSFRASTSLNHFQFLYVAAAYTMNGTFKGYAPIETLFNYCTRKSPFSAQGGGTSSSTGWQLFGSTQKTIYKCDLETTLSKEQLFYELFLFDSTWPTGLYPVPVRIVGTKRSGATTNTLHPSFLCDSSDALVRRFFLTDTVSGISSSAASSALPSVIRYASDIILEVAISDSPKGIYAPVLTIQYKESVPATWSLADAKTQFVSTNDGSNTVSYTFWARYSMDMSNFKNTLFGFFIAAIVFCGLYFLLRFNNWNMRHSRVMQSGTVSTGLNIRSFVEFCILAMSSWVYFFFPFQLLICWYFFVFFKLQSVPSIMLPPMDLVYTTSSPYFIFVANLHVMAFFHFAYVLALIYKQCNADIFFLDWEPPSTVALKGSKNEVSAPGRVSVWRTIFVANEWSEMQTLRKTDIAFTLFWMAFFLVGIGEDYVATQQPDVSNKNVGDTNIVLRFANTCFWWIMLSFAQYMWKFLIYERFIAETPEQIFIDFCTIAKVSILVLDEPFHGYYLHCRSPHQHADGSMAELVDMLHKEEAGLTVDRSLEGGPSDVQSFQIFVTGEWRTAFSKIYQSLVRPPSVSEMLTTGRTRGRGGGAASRMNSSGGTGINSLPPDRVMKAWKELCVFLQEFVENNFGRPGLRRVVREATYLEKMTSYPPDLAAPEQPSVFFPDRNFDYCKMLFLGRELELLLLNILSYSLFDLWFGSTAISILMCYLLDWCLCFVRKRWGQAIISSKTLIDERFLM